MEHAILEKIVCIQRLIFLINPTPTNQYFTGDKPTILSNSYGHTNEIQVEIYANGWNGEVNPDQVYRIRLDSPEAIAQLDDCIRVLCHLLRVEEAEV